MPDAPTNDAISATLVAWLTEAGLAGQSERNLLDGFCERAADAGLRLCRASLVVDTLHPIYEGRVFRWQRGDAEIAVTEYGRSTEGAASESWRRSPFYHLLELGRTKGRWRIPAEDAPDFPILAELRDAGVTDYVCIVTRFAGAGIIGEIDSVLSSWATDTPGGFDARQLALLEALVPALALSVKCSSLGQIAGTLVETYLGRDAGRRVLSGRIMRGVGERIRAVLWFSDLRGYTRITDTAPPEQIIPLLNDYAEAVISAIHSAGGDVLKLMGDGILAIFRAPETKAVVDGSIGAETAGEAWAAACAAALAAAAVARAGITALNAQRAQVGLPTTHMYLGLHVGVVFYGNIGSVDRLDFTVVGPAVNEVSRIAAMCRSVDQEILLSAAFVEAAGEGKKRLVSVGRYALRGAGRPQELFTLDSEEINPRDFPAED
jgi:adenylate cyclase